MHLIRFLPGLRSRPPLRELTTFPQTPSCILKGPTSKGKEGKGRGEKGREGEGKWER